MTVNLETASRTQAKGYVLLVDDDPDFLEIHEKALKAAGYEVRKAYDGTEALNILQEKTPDVMVLDVIMSTLTEGLDLAYKLKNDPAFSKIPIVLATAMAKHERFPQAFEFIMERDWPAVAYYDKPVNPMELVKVIDRVVAAVKAA